MSSRIEQATVALVTLLEALPGVTVLRNCDVPISFVTDATPTVNVVDGDDVDEAPRFVAANVAEFDTELRVVGYVTSADFADLGPARDALWLAVWKIVTANRVLGSELTWDVRPRATQRRLESEPGKPVAAFELPVVLRLTAQIDDPAIAA
jgi:hypothetical protein